MFCDITRRLYYHACYMPQKCSEEASNKLIRRLCTGEVLASAMSSENGVECSACDFLNGRQIKEEVWQGIGGMDYDAEQPADRMLPPSCSPHSSVQSLLAAAPTSDPVSGLTLLLFNEYSRQLVTTKLIFERKVYLNCMCVGCKQL